VPQNIDLEDKIVGPFTMKQFLYLFVGGFLLYGWWNYANSFVNTMAIFLPLALPLGLLCFCLAVIKINDRPFEFFLLNLVRFLAAPKYRKWITGYSPETVITLDPLEAKNNKDEHLKSESDLDSLAKQLEEQTSKIRSEAATALSGKPITTQAKPRNINLSVSDLGSAAQKQQQAQSTPAPKQVAAANQNAPAPAPVKAKKGLLSIFK